MSNFGPSLNKDSLVVKSSAISNSDVLSALASVDQNIGILEDALGDVNGYGTSSDKSFKTSLSGSIGDMSKASIDIPIGVKFTDYTESFSPDDSNDFVLGLIPESDLEIIDSDNKIYVGVKNRPLTNNNEYSINGRRLVFHTKPSSVFSVRYTGKYPSIAGLEDITGYMPNIYPSPELLESGDQDRARIDAKGNGFFEVTVFPANKNKFGDIFSSKLEYSLSEKLSEFISPTGGTICPSEHIGIWKKFGDKYQRIDDAKVSIISPNKVRFQTGVQINPSSDIIIIAVNNWTIADSISFISRYVLNHKHSSSELGSQISHFDLVGLRADRYNKGEAQYGVSKISGDDHPQYFNREGFISDNPGNFNNAIIGDMLIGSVNEFNLYNNNSADSRKIYFGSTAGASSLMYSRDFGGIRLYGSENGLKIETHSNPSDTKTRYGKALNVDGNMIYANGGIIDNGVENPTYLHIDPKDGKLYVGNEDNKTTIYVDSIDTSNLSTNGTISISGDESSVKIGNISLSDNGGNVSVSSDDENSSITFSAKANFDGLDVKELSPTLIEIKDDSKIRFGDENGDYIFEDENSINVKNVKPLNFISSGKNTGISVKAKGYTPFLNLYSSAEGGGSSTQTDHDTYIESGNGDVYFLKDTKNKVIKDGTKYVFGENDDTSSERVDNLKLWPRSNINAALGDFESLNVLPSSLKERRGLNIGTAASIYATGNDTDCPPGWLVFESKNGAVFIDSRSGAIDCQSITYSEVSTGPLKVFGTLSVDKDIGVSGDLNVAGNIYASVLTIDARATLGSIEVKEDSRFSANVSFTEDVRINSKLEVGGSITTENSISANEINVKGKATLNDGLDISGAINSKANINTDFSIIAEKDVRVGNKLTTKELLSEEATIYSLRTTDVVRTQGGIISASTIESSAPIITSSNMRANSILLSDKVQARVIESETTITSGGDMYVSGKFQAMGDITLGDTGRKVLVAGDTILNNNKTSVLGVLEVSQEATFKGDTDIIGRMNVGSSAIFKSGLEVYGPINSTSSAKYNNITVVDQSIFGADMQVGGRLSVGDSVSVNGLLTVNGNTTLGNDSSSVTILGKSQFNKPTLFSDKVSMTGDMSVTGNATISGDININSKMIIEGELNSRGNGNIGGILTANGIKSNGQAEFVGGLTSLKTITTEDLTVSNISNFGNGIFVTGASSFVGGISTLPSDTATLGVVNVATSINQSNNNTSNQFAGNTFFNNGVTIAKDTLIKGALRTGSDSNGCLIEANSISLIGDTSIIKSKSASFENISGTKQISIPTNGYNSSALNEVRSMATNKTYVSVDNLHIEDMQVNKSDIVCLGTIYVGNIQTIETGNNNTSFNERSVALQMRVARARYAP